MISLNRTALLEGLVELSSADLQLKRWANVKNDDQETSSFEEAVCQVFDDSNYLKIIESKHLASPFSAEIENLLIELSALVDKVPTSASANTLIHHPSMSSVREVSRQILQQLHGSG